MGFDSIKQFEEELAKFFGAPYAITTDCCTHAIELSLRWTGTKSIECPKRTYLSVPMLADKLGISLSWRDENWKDFYYVAPNVIDAAVLWKEGSYIPGTFMCVSFQFKKHLNLGRGGVILTDNRHAASDLKRMSYDGRVPDVLWRNQSIDMMGYHYYMTPETAALGLEKLPAAIANTPQQWTVNDWPDISEMPIFRKK